jgi:hypothetical protein
MASEKKTKKTLQEIIKEECDKLISEQDTYDYVGSESLIQDPIGGRVRPDQLKALAVDGLQQCLAFAKNDMWEFVSMLKNVALRVNALKELYEDQDDHVD